MDEQFDGICGLNKQFDSRYDTLNEMRSYIDGKIDSSGHLGGSNYMPQEDVMETATDLLVFLDQLENQFRDICGEKTDYVLEDGTHGVDCRYQLVMQMRDEITEMIEEKIRQIRPEYASVPAGAESETSVKAA
jgi:hypothetical protein